MHKETDHGLTASNNNAPESEGAKKESKLSIGGLRTLKKTDD